jgi:plasmid stabilization system protein ParE
MDEYSIVFAPSAEEELEIIVAWLNENAPEKISEWLNSLRMDIDTLKILPERWPYAPENGLWGDEELRQLLFQRHSSKYRVIFTLSEMTVRILHVRHGSRRYLFEE